MLVLVFGAGTDYALLLIARYREELRRHSDRYTAMAVAWRRSFPAILASAATVAVGTAVPARRADERRARPRPGRGGRHRRRVRGDDHAAARPAGPARPVGVLAVRPAVSRRRPAPTGAPARHLAPPGRRDRPAAPGDLDAHHARARRARPSACSGCGSGQPADKMFTTEVESVVGQRTRRAALPRRRLGSRRDHRRGAARRRGRRGGGGGRRGRRRRRASASRRTAGGCASTPCCATRPTPPPPRRPSTASAARCTRCPAADALVGGQTAARRRHRARRRAATTGS